METTVIKGPGEGWKLPKNSKKKKQLTHPELLEKLAATIPKMTKPGKNTDNRPPIPTERSEWRIEREEVEIGDTGSFETVEKKKKVKLMPSSEQYCVWAGDYVATEGNLAHNDLKKRIVLLAEWQEAEEKQRNTQLAKTIANIPDTVLNSKEIAELREADADNKQLITKLMGEITSLTERVQQLENAQK